MKRRFDLVKPGDRILQRCMSASAGARWRTVCAFGEAHAPGIDRAVLLMAMADHRVLWRVVEGADPECVVARWDGERWV